MVLVDHQIEARVASSGMIDSYDRSCLTNIGYDLRMKNFYRSREDQDGVKRIVLKPNESVFAESVETVTVPEELLARVVLKNSRIRQGLSLESPVYQPGHKTRIYFRLTNVSSDEITLTEDERYAMVLFEELGAKPEKPYSGAFRDEFDFRGLGEYRRTYNRQIRELEKRAEDLKEMERGIYTNVLTILTVFVALFSFLTTNIALTVNSAGIKEYFAFNALLLGCISFLVAMLNHFIHWKKANWKQWLPAAAAFGGALAVYLLL